MRRRHTASHCPPAANRWPSQRAGSEFLSPHVPRSISRISVQLSSIPWLVCRCDVSSLPKWTSSARIFRHHRHTGPAKISKASCTMGRIGLGLVSSDDVGRGRRRQRVLVAGPQPGLHYSLYFKCRREMEQIVGLGHSALHTPLVGGLWKERKKERKKRTIVVKCRLGGPLSHHFSPKRPSC
ncbi:uncharacterized protein LY79DRAFT_262453 [Colletotrichum navitas]|uniref:Uncharacterized protein n=1 Tax=Colletotrichum navitas TaxID=681940 RepID=A0AAD8PXP6_9PEZI|nr:uncharacterized protein LY79DRAFT_262453 [Colletotrichum navitas]KAK1585648.1 hypothetical protein LY79DRAFT_262453 [Colletotrichum navitas]